MATKNSTTFKVGDRVGVMFDDYDNRIVLPHEKHYAIAIACYGTVSSLVDTERVIIKWDYAAPISQTCLYCNELQTEKALQQQRSTMEKEWNATLKEVNQKISSIAQDITNVSKLTKNIPEERLYEAVHSIYYALDRCGWQASSFQC